MSLLNAETPVGPVYPRKVSAPLFEWEQESVSGKIHSANSIPLDRQTFQEKVGNGCVVNASINIGNKKVNCIACLTIRMIVVTQRLH